MGRWVDDALMTATRAAPGCLATGPDATLRAPRAPCRPIDCSPFSRCSDRFAPRRLRHAMERGERHAEHPALPELRGRARANSTSGRPSGSCRSRWRATSSTGRSRAGVAHSPLGADLDSLADVVSFGVAPAVLGFALGLRGAWDALPSCTSSPAGSAASRGNVTAAELSDERGKVRYYEGTPIPTSWLIVLLGVPSPRSACTSSSGSGRSRSAPGCSTRSAWSMP